MVTAAPALRWIGNLSRGVARLTAGIGAGPPRDPAQGTNETDVQPPVKTSRSYEILPPHMSELKVVLLGSSWSERSSVGNFILGVTGVDKAPKGFERMTGPLKNKTIAIINTPDLPSDISQHQLTEFITECVRLSDPGPHVFLLVLQPEDFTEEQRQSLCKVLETFSDRSFDHSLVLKLTPKKVLGSFGKNKETLKDMIRKCRYRHLKHKNLEHEELLTRLGQVAKENNGEHVSYEASEDTADTQPDGPEQNETDYNHTL